jgi:FtsH-binding integral membrane protein
MIVPMNHQPVPATVVLAVRLMFVNVGLGLIGVLFAFIFTDQIRDNIRDKHPDDSPSEINHRVNNAVVLTAFVLVIVAALYAALALQVNNGQNWARVGTWALSAFSVLDAVGALTGNDAAASKSVDLTQGVIEVVIVVLLALGPSRRFFTKRR